ncbi:ATP-binding protein [Streptomyces mayteni]
MTVPLTQPSRCLRDWEVSVHLHPDDRAPRLCRASAAGAVMAYGLPELAEPAELVVSELVTNAVQHGRGPLAFRVAWFAVRGRLRLTVWDDGPGWAPLRPARPADDVESGRGLLIVAALAVDWGQYAMPGAGKALWAELGPGAP